MMSKELERIPEPDDICPWEEGDYGEEMDEGFIDPHQPTKDRYERMENERWSRDHEELDVRENAFLIELFRSADYAKAYWHAYHPGKVSRQFCMDKGRYLSNLPRIASRLTEMRRAAARDIGITNASVLSEMAATAFADPGDMQFQNDGLFTSEQFYAMPEGLRKSCKVKVTTKHGKDGQLQTMFSVEYDPKVRIAMIDGIAKHLGIYEADNQQQSGLLSMKDIMQLVDGATREIQREVIEVKAEETNDD